MAGQNNPGSNLGLPRRSETSLPVVPRQTASSRPSDIVAYLEEQGVPLNLPIMPGDTGVGPMPLMFHHMPGATAEQMQEVYRRERAGYLYQVLSDMGYFHMDPSTRPSARELLQKRFQSMPHASTYAPRSNSPEPTSISIEEGGELRMKKSNLGENALSSEEFKDGDTIEVLYTENQVNAKRQGQNVTITPSMVMKSSSVEALIKRGYFKNPLTREPIALRERRILRFTNTAGGKRKRRKTQRKTKRKNQKY